MRGVASFCHLSENIRHGEKRKMRKKCLEHYAARRTITFNINKITKYESPAAKCPHTLLYFTTRAATAPLASQDLFFKFAFSYEVLLFLCMVYFTAIYKMDQI